jgi:hypothetical protein
MTHDKKMFARVDHFSALRNGALVLLFRRTKPIVTPTGDRDNRCPHRKLHPTGKCRPDLPARARRRGDRMKEGASKSWRDQPV